MKYILFLLTFACFAHPALAQEDTSERILDDNIRSVQLNAGAVTPVVDLKNGQINLTFDYVTDEIMDFVYTIVHCNSDWLPSELGDNEYINGFTEDRITNITNSINTLVAYNYYQMSLPNSNMKWARSGNYILKIFDDNDDHRLVLVRRFMVSENRWKVAAKLSPVINSSKIFTHQEIDFQVVHEGTIIGNPEREVKAFVIQNMRWDRMMGPIAPRPFITTRSSLNFDFQDSIVFPAGKEFRYFDIRTFDFKGNNVLKIQRNPDTYQVFLQPEHDREDSHSYGLTGDINGRFSIENRSQGQSFMQSDYANIMFILSRNAAFEDKEVYVVGAMTDWQLKPEFKMRYDAPSKSYFCNPLLKQGFYNYEFQVVNDYDYRISKADDMEGNWHETENLYNVFVYYRPYGERYDRLMSSGGITSGPNNK